MKVSKLRAKTSTRHLAGEDIPRADTTSFGMRNALKRAKRASGGVCMGEVDGEPARGRLDKAVVRRAAGGPVKRGFGGLLSEAKGPGGKPIGGFLDALGGGDGGLMGALGGGDSPDGDAKDLGSKLLPMLGGFKRGGKVGKAK